MTVPRRGVRWEISGSHNLQPPSPFSLPSSTTPSRRWGFDSTTSHLRSRLGSPEREHMARNRIEGSFSGNKRPYAT